MLERVRASLGRWIGGRPAADLASRRLNARAVALAMRMYANARPSRLNADWPASTSSADTELATSLTRLRNESRALIRDNPYAQRACTIVVNNVIGSGIGMQAQVMSTRGDLNERVNNGIEEAFGDWSQAENCHTGGRLHFADLERLLMAEVFAAGEIFVRKHPFAFGRSRVPFALEVIEPERIADEWTTANPPPGGGIARMGIEVDRWDRPMYYWIRERHPGELRSIPGSSQRLERVPADQIIHLMLPGRWPQTRGEPWLHAVIQRLRDMGGYTEAEIIAARAAACYMGFIKSDEVPVSDGTESEPQVMEFQPGMVEHLAPGEEFQGWSPNRPNTALAEFMRHMVREYAAGVGVSYESVSRDYSQSNYSSSRLALLDDRDLWRMLQGWFIRNFREPIHREWLQAAVLARAVTGVSVEEYAVNRRTFEAVRFKPRGWGWIDPTKEVQAYKEAVRCGFTTVTDVIAATAGGQDIEDVIATRERELKLMRDKGLTFDTDPALSPASPGSPSSGPAAADGEPPETGEGKKPALPPLTQPPFSLIARRSHA